jgi:hypothetical protein
MTAQLTIYFSDTSNNLFSLVKTTIAFQVNELPDIAEGDLTEMIRQSSNMRALSY